MAPNDVTVGILKDIRTEIRQVRQDLSQRIDQTNVRLDRTNERLDQTREEIGAMREELSRRIVESEIRTSTAIADLAGAVHEMTGVLRAANDLRPRVERCEEDIAALQRRVGSRE